MGHIGGIVNPGIKTPLLALKTSNTELVSGTAVPTPTVCALTQAAQPIAIIKIKSFFIFFSFL
jgi:hypothetical protein